MEPLATAEQVAARLGRDLTIEEDIRIDAVLADVSANVRRISTQQFTPGTSTVTVARGRYGRVRLPQRPIVTVTSVVDINGNALSYVRVGEQIELRCTAVNGWETEPYRYAQPSEVVITYDHGGDVPDVIVGVVCSIAARTLGTNPIDTGRTQEAIDGYSYMMGSAAAQGGIGMLPSEIEICESFKRPSSPIVMDDA